MKPGIYEMPASEYHADPCPEPSLSSSMIRTLLYASPQHAWLKHPKLGNAPTEHRSAFDIGTAAHSILLEGVDSVRVVGADSWRTKAAKEERDDAWEMGQVPLLVAQYEEVMAMVETALSQVGDLLLPQEPERTVIWKEGGIHPPVWCRARADKLTDSMLIDYKTTKALARPESYQRILWRLRYDIQIAWYLRGVIEQSDNWVDHRIIVQETSPPYAVSVIRIDPQALSFAHRECSRAVELWGSCLASGEWPAYGTEPYTVTAPGWLAENLDFTGLEIEGES